MRAAVLALLLVVVGAAPAAAVEPGTLDLSVGDVFDTLSGSFAREAVFTPDGRIVAVGNAAQGFASRIGVTRRMYTTRATAASTPRSTARAGSSRWASASHGRCTRGPWRG